MYSDYHNTFHGRWVICDLDDTLFALTPEMVDWVKSKQYDKYNAVVHTGDCITIVRDVLNLMYQNGAKVCMMTARSEEVREQTIGQLMAHRVHFDSLIMRPLGWQHPSTALKPMLINQFFRLPTVALVLEDRDEVVAAIRAMGLQVWQVRKGQY